MLTCFHTTKSNNLKDILESGGLQSIYGANSALTAEAREGNVYYSAGIQAMFSTVEIFNWFYLRVQDERIREDEFRRNLSPEAYIQHQKSIIEILKSENFDDWMKDNVYLCFDGDSLSDRNEENPENSYTSDVIPSEQLKVCIIRNKKDNSICIFSMKDIYNFFRAKNPELGEDFYICDDKEYIQKYKNDDYYIDYLSLEQFCELFPELTAHKEESEDLDIYLSFLNNNKRLDKESLKNWIDRKKIYIRLTKDIEKIDVGEFSKEDVPQFLEDYFRSLNDYSRSDEENEIINKLRNNIYKIEKIIIEDENDWNNRLGEYIRKFDSGEFTEDDIPQFIDDYFRKAYSNEKNGNQLQIRNTLWKIDEILTKYIEETELSDSKSKKIDYDLVESKLIKYIKKIDTGEFLIEDVPQFINAYCRRDHKSSNRIELMNRIQMNKDITNILEEGIKDKLQGICPYSIVFSEWRF